MKESNTSTYAKKAKVSKKILSNIKYSVGVNESRMENDNSNFFQKSTQKRKQSRSGTKSVERERENGNE
jgi:hypothetical protein